MNDKILCIDDDLNLLEAYRRQLRKHFQIETATGGEQALAMLAEGKRYAVIVSDMRMPKMAGIELLARVREICPDTVRIMLTGNADLQTAVDAVNEGHIFRFLSKPCTREVLCKTLEAGVEQHRLITAERDLLSKTLTGSVKLLTDVLSLVCPAAFERSTRARRLARQLCAALRAEHAWQIELAAALSQIGCIAAPAETLQKAFCGHELTPDQAQLMLGHPQVGRELVANVPRMEKVAEIIAYQNKQFDGSGGPRDGVKEDEIPLGGRVLKLALDYDLLAAGGCTPEEAFAELNKRRGWYDPNVLAALKEVLALQREQVVRSAPIFRLPDNVILAEEILTTAGTIVASKGQEMTASLRMRLNAYMRSVGVREPVSYYAPAGEAPATAGASRIVAELASPPASTEVIEPAFG